MTAVLATSGPDTETYPALLTYLQELPPPPSHVEVWVAEFHRDNPTVKSLDWVPERA